VSRSYIVRVAATDLDTTVKWETANGQTTGSKVITRGEFVQIRNPLATQPMLVTCDKPCLVMLYNTGSIISTGQIGIAWSSVKLECWQLSWQIFQPYGRSMSCIFEIGCPNSIITL